MPKASDVCRQELARRRQIVELFVFAHYDYLESPTSTLPMKERPYFGAKASTFTRAIEGKVYSYSLPDLGMTGTHNSKCRDQSTFGTPVYSAKPSDFLRRRPNLSKVAKEQLSNNKLLNAHLRRHRNFWVDELFKSTVVNTSEGGYRQVLESLSIGLLDEVVAAFEADAVLGSNPGDERVQQQFLVITAGSAFFDCLNVFRGECSHFDRRKCLSCGIEFLPEAVTYSWMGGGPYFCAFCVQAATDPLNDFYYIGMSNQQLLALLEFGLGNQGEETQTVLSQIRGRNPNNEPATHLASLGVASMAPEEALEALARISVRPRTALTELAGLSIEEWVFKHTTNPSRGAIATDGHFCQSKGERTICEYLNRRGINHSMHPRYSDFTQHQDTLIAMYKGDFRVSDSIIEFAGLTNTEYLERLALKERIAQAHGIDLVIVRDGDLRNLDVVFEKFLQEKGSSPFLF
jgi:hypothetical protein